MPNTADLLTQDDPDDLGIQIWRNAIGISWYGTTGWSTDPQLVDRDSLAPDGPIFSTFYASISAQTLSKGVQIPGGVGVYGSEWCHGATTGAFNGFDCDANHWWNPSGAGGSTTSPMPTETGGTISTECTTGLAQPVPNCRERGVKPGQVYQFRDIDCWDGTLVRGTGVAASLVAASGEPFCADAP